MIIDAISDLHGYYPKLEGGDLLIIAGDLTARDTNKEYEGFFTWLSLQDQYRKKIVISGNHDNGMIGIQNSKVPNGIYSGFECCEYLCDSGIEFEGLKIWGSPWSLWFKGINPKCTAFTGNEEDLMKKYSIIPNDIDILITHTPPYGVLDGIYLEDGSEYPTGSKNLRNLVFDTYYFKKLKHHFFGHIHEYGGQSYESILCGFHNCSYVNERYKPVNKPIRVVL